MNIHTHADIYGIRSYNMKFVINVFMIVFALGAIFLPIQTMCIALLAGIVLFKSLRTYLKEYYSEKENIRNDLIFPFLPIALMFITYLFGSMQAVNLIRFLNIGLMTIAYNYVNQIFKK